MPFKRKTLAITLVGGLAVVALLLTLYAVGSNVDIAAILRGLHGG